MRLDGAVRSALFAGALTEVGQKTGSAGMRFSLTSWDPSPLCLCLGLQLPHGDSHSFAHHSRRLFSVEEVWMKSTLQSKALRRKTSYVLIKIS